MVMWQSGHWREYGERFYSFLIFFVAVLIRIFCRERVDLTMTYEERLELFKSRVSTMPCTYAEETDREGLKYEVMDKDYEWLMRVLEGKDIALESFSRIVEGMEADYNKAKEEIRELKQFKADAEKLFQRQKLGFAKSAETREQLEADRNLWKEKYLLLKREMEQANEFRRIY